MLYLTLYPKCRVFLICKEPSWTNMLILLRSPGLEFSFSKKDHFYDTSRDSLASNTLREKQWLEVCGMLPDFVRINFRKWMFVIDHSGIIKKCEWLPVSHLNNISIIHGERSTSIKSNYFVHKKAKANGSHLNNVEPILCKILNWCYFHELKNHWYELTISFIRVRYWR